MHVSFTFRPWFESIFCNLLLTTISCVNCSSVMKILTIFFRRIELACQSMDTTIVVSHSVDAFGASTLHELSELFESDAIPPGRHPDICLPGTTGCCCCFCRSCSPRRRRRRCWQCRRRGVSAHGAPSAVSADGLSADSNLLTRLPAASISVVIGIPAMTHPFTLTLINCQSTGKKHKKTRV